MDDERFDGLYLNVAQTTRGIDPLLHTLFSFLRRKTDFFTEKGTDVAMEKINEVMRQHVEIIKNQEKKKAPKKALQPKKKVVAPKKSEPAVVEMGKDGGFDIEETPPPPAAAAASPAALAAEKFDQMQKAESDKMLAEKKDEKDDKTSDDDKKAPPPVGNGGTVAGKYAWTQLLSEINVIVPVPDNTRGKDLNVTIAKNHLKVGLRSQPGTWIIDDLLTKSVVCDDSFWTVEDGNRLSINLQKLSDMEWWDSVCRNDPKIDVRAIQPESSSISDLDGETRKTVEKMMYDQRQKALGLPSSDEETKMGMFEKFKNQHPEMDFSNAKIT